VPDDAPRRAEGVNYDIIDGVAVVLDAEGTELIRLNEVGTFVWEHLDGKRDVAALVEELWPALDGVTREEFERDVREYLGELRDAGILEPSERSSS